MLIAVRNPDDHKIDQQIEVVISRRSHRHEYESDTVNEIQQTTIPLKTKMVQTKSAGNSSEYFSFDIEFPPSSLPRSGPPR